MPARALDEHDVGDHCLQSIRRALLPVGAAVDPACAAFEYRKKPRRREYVRLRLECGTDDAPVASMFPREG